MSECLVFGFGFVLFSIIPFDVLFDVCGCVHLHSAHLRAGAGAIVLGPSCVGRGASTFCGWIIQFYSIGCLGVWLGFLREGTQFALFRFPLVFIDLN
jgi:hypothetical protein